MMLLTFDDLKQILDQKGIKLSFQRLKVLEYLTIHHSHPTADRIFSDLQVELPTLSKTTVYNTLRILVDAKLVRIVNIEEAEARYDLVAKSHGHFKCETCGRIDNFSIDIETVPFGDLEDYQIDLKDVYFKGICSRCLSNNIKIAK
jgi:Fur family transcriptional regulator, peroxide stress response regulator